MQRDNNVLFFLSAALILGGVQLAGCAAPPEPSVGAEAAPPPEQQVAGAEQAQPVEAEPTVAKALEALQQAEQAYQEEDYDRARTLYAALAQNPAGLSEEQLEGVRGRLGRIDAVLQQRALDERTKAAQDLLAQAAALVGEEKHGEAAEKLTALKEMTDLLTSDQQAQFGELCNSVAQATGLMPGMTDEEAEQAAERCLDAGMDAYKAKRYGDAKAELDKAALLKQHLSSRARQKVQQTLQTVEATLADLEMQYRQAAEHFAGERYAEAKQALEAIKAGSISAGAEMDEAVNSLLAQADQKLAEQGERAEAERRTRAEELVAKAGALVAEQSYGEAAPLLAELKELEGYLSADQLATVRGLRVAVAEATGELAGMAPEEAQALASAWLDQGVAAYEADRYADAKTQLDKAARWDQYLSSRGKRKLREVRPKVEDTLARLLADVEKAKEQLAAEQYGDAEGTLQSVQASGVSMGAEQDQQVQDMLAKAQAGIEELRQRAEQEKRDRVAELLAQANALSAEGKQEEAAEKLTALRELEGCLTADQMAEFQKAREAVEEATGVLPGMTAEEREERAEQYFEQGVQAYKDKDYAEAKKCLDRAAVLNVGLGWWDNRTLRRTRARVTETLDGLLRDYERGKQLFSEEQYAEAKDALQAVKSSGISIGADKDKEVADLLAAIDEKVAERQRQEEEQGRQRAADLLAEAEKLNAGGKSEEALARLDALQEVAGYLSPEQQEHVAALRISTESAAEIARIEGAQKQAEELARQAADLVQKRSAVTAKVDAAEQAWRAGNLQEARSALTEAQQMLATMDVSGMPALAGLAQQVEQRLRDVDTQVKLSQMADEARELAKADLLAAEKKVLQIRDLATQGGLTLTGPAQEICDAVLAAVEAEYGVERRLRPEEFRRMVDLSDAYRAAGECGKAVELLSLVKGAGADMVTEDYRNLAVGKLGAAEQELEQQKAAAERVMAQLTGARAELEGGELEKALDSVAAVVPMSTAERLAGAPLVDVLEKAVSFLETEFGQAMAAAGPDFDALADGELSRANVETARGLSQYYLEAGSPELAEFYLNELAKGGPARDQYSGWASQQLEGIAALKAEAERARLLEVEPQAQRVYDLAAELNRLAREGDLSQVEAVNQQLADARLDLQMRRVQSALKRGAFTQAFALLQEAPLEGASSAAVAQLYQPLSDRIESLRSAAAGLQSAEKALTAHEFEKAVAYLQEVQQSGVDAIGEAQPLVMQKQGLAGVLDAVRSAQDAQAGLRAAQQEELASARAALDQARAREKSWQQYYAGMRAFLLGEDGAVAKLKEALAEPAALQPFEAAEAKQVVDALAATAGPELLVNDEQKARALYEEAVQAYGAKDAAGVNRALQELKTRYSHTKVYRDHM